MSLGFKRLSVSKLHGATTRIWLKSFLNYTLLCLQIDMILSGKLILTLHKNKLISSAG